jgi:hypothetical protein
MVPGLNEKYSSSLKTECVFSQFENFIHKNAFSGRPQSNINSKESGS